jgi:hypothetical protein
MQTLTTIFTWSAIAIVAYMGVMLSVGTAFVS